MKKGSSIMLRLLKTPHNGRAKDGFVSPAEGLAPVGRVVGRRVAWAQSLAAVGDSPGDVVRPRPADRDQLAAGGGDSRRLQRLLLLPAACGPQDQRAGRAARRLQE